MKPYKLLDFALDLFRHMVEKSGGRESNRPT